MDPASIALSIAGGQSSSMMGMLGGYFASKSLMRYQSKLNRQNLVWNSKNLPSLQRTGFENAGFNPLLIYGASAPSVSPASIPSVPSSGFASGAASLLQAMTGQEQAKNQKMYNDALIDNAKAEIDNKKAQTDVLKAQAEETRLNNSETRRITENRDNMKHVIDLLKSRIDYIRSGAGSTHSSFGFKLPFGLGHYSRDENRDNSSIDGVIHALDLMIKKYGGGSFDSLDNDIQFDTLMGVPSQLERDNAKYVRDRNDRLRMEVIDESDPRHFQAVEHAKQQLRLQKEQKREERERKRNERIKNYKVPKAPSKRSVDIYRNLYNVPGMSLFR